MLICNRQTWNMMIVLARKHTDMPFGFEPVGMPEYFHMLAEPLCKANL